MSALAAVKALAVQKAADGGVALNVGGIKQFAFQIIAVLLLIIAAGMVLRSGKAKISDNASTAANIVIAGLIAIAGIALFKFGGQLGDLVFTS